MPDKNGRIVACLLPSALSVRTSQGGPSDQFIRESISLRKQQSQGGLCTK